MPESDWLDELKAAVANGTWTAGHLVAHMHHLIACTELVTNAVRMPCERFAPEPGDCQSIEHEDDRCFPCRARAIVKGDE